MIRRALLGVALAVALTAPARAQPALDFPLGPILDLASHADLSVSAFRNALDVALPDVALSDVAARSAADESEDPFLWALSGAFGGQGASPRPGAILSCTRYGLATRDAFAERGLSDPDMFALMSVLRPAFDDAEVWPNGAVARLACTFTWDDAETVAILPRAAASAALAARYATLGDHAAQDTASLLHGPGGYDLRARNGRSDTHVVIESGAVTLTMGHQSVSFRSFVMGGWM